MLPALLLVLYAGCNGPDGEALDIPYDDFGMKLDGVSEPPPLSIDPERPLSGQAVRIVARDPSAASLVVTASGVGCGDVVGGSGSTVDVTAAAGDQGSCMVTARALGGDGSEIRTMETRFYVQSIEPDAPNLEIDGAAWVPGPLQGRPGDPAAPVVLSLVGPTTFINGAALSFTAEVDSEAAIATLVIEVPGYEGAFYLPMANPTLREQVDTGFNLHVPSTWFKNDRGGLSRIIFHVIDRIGRRSQPVEQPLTGQQVGTGDVQVGITWNSPSDVDLHVVEPSGNEIFYGAPTSATGGQLDLDSNAGCSIDGINHENVFWPPGQSPAGDYTVRVVWYSACEQPTADGTVTITHCGESSPEVHPFSLSAGEATFQFSSKCSSSVSGDVRYEDYASTLQGLSVESAMVPVRYATVQVRRADDNLLLAEGHTDGVGHYNIEFVNDGTPGYRLELVARADGVHARHEVQTLRGHPYAWQDSIVYDETQFPQNVKDIEIPAFKGAGALNIFEVATRSYEHARAASGRIIPPLLLRWTDRRRPYGLDASFYLSSEGAIYIYGDPADSDVYDDVIIGHEFGHFLMDTIGRATSGGGTHSSSNRVRPTLAWSEGWATFFGTQVAQVSSYIDTSATGLSVGYSIEYPPADKPLGNGGTMSGNLSEAIVAATLFDIADDSSETGDTIDRQAHAVWSTFSGTFVTSTRDRGAEGADLIDFLDDWICNDYGDVGLNDREGLHGIVTYLHQLTYDWSPTCQ